MCALLTATLDSAISGQVWDEDGVAVVALGGYGREELSPHSDVDLMLLHSLDDPSRAASRLFRPLWDAGLRVGHSVRTVAEAAAGARDRYDTHTTLLTARLVAGDRSLFDGLMERVQAVTRARPLRRHLVAEELERRRRWPYLVMTPDLKNGRGGLRTLQGLEWERRREAMIGRFTAAVAPEEASAGEMLLRTRNALHAITGRPHDVLSAELREQVSTWLGSDLREAIQTVLDAIHEVDRLATRHWPEIVDPPHRRRSRLVRLGGRPLPLPTAHRTAGEGLVTLLGDSGMGRDALERLLETAMLDDLIPEWATVRSRAQLEPFHDHPVGDHLWRTVDEMRCLIDDRGHHGRVAAELDEPLLLLSAFLHDIGKGSGRDHSVAGAAVARRVCDRIGLPPSLASTVERVVRHHLLLSVTATRRDLGDPAVIEETVEKVADLETLQALYLLTIADSRATGPSMWNPWKATLLRTLFTNCAARFGADRPLRVGVDPADLISQVPEDLRERVASYLAAMPAEYLRDNDIDDVVWHLGMLERSVGGLSLEVRHDTPVEKVAVVGVGDAATRAKVGEVFAAHGIDVLEARMSTGADGTLVDTFRVRDDRTGEAVPPARWGAVRADIGELAAGGEGPGRRLAERVASYGGPHHGPIEPEARVDLDPASSAVVVTVKCSDRIGRLGEILRVLAGLGLEVRLAKLESRGGEVVDTFHVSGADADVGVDELGARIAASISP